jgi:hypothetical protein
VVEVQNERRQRLRCAWECVLLAGAVGMGAAVAGDMLAARGIAGGSARTHRRGRSAQVPQDRTGRPLGSGRPCPRKSQPEEFVQHVQTVFVVHQEPAHSPMLDVFGGEPQVEATDHRVVDGSHALNGSAAGGGWGGRLSWASHRWAPRGAGGRARTHGAQVVERWQDKVAEGVKEKYKAPAIHAHHLRR